MEEVVEAKGFEALEYRVLKSNKIKCCRSRQHMIARPRRVRKCSEMPTPHTHLTDSTRVRE